MTAANREALSTQKLAEDRWHKRRVTLGFGGNQPFSSSQYIG